MTYPLSALAARLREIAELHPRGHADHLLLIYAAEVFEAMYAEGTQRKHGQSEGPTDQSADTH